MAVLNKRNMSPGHPLVFLYASIVRLKRPGPGPYKHRVGSCVLNGYTNDLVYAIITMFGLTRRFAGASCARLFKSPSISKSILF